MANEDYHEMEMSRRSIKINTIRQELEDASEREQEAQERLAQLDRQIQEKKVHIVVFKQNAQGMEDQAAAAEAFCLQNHRLMKEDEEDVLSEAEALNEKLAKTARSLEKAQADAIQAQRAAEAQEEAKKRQAEETAKHAAQLATLEATMAAATADVESIQETIRELEVTLEMEKKTGKELQDSVNAEEEKRQETQLECDRLMHFLESLSSRGNKEELSKALAAMQREHSQLQQELITKKTNVLIKQQEIRGRLDETRRIHEERKGSAADVAAIALNASGPIAALTVTLEEERRKAEAVRETRLQLEAEVKALEKQLAESPKVNLQSAQRPTEPAKCENDQSGQEELQAAQEKLDAAKRQLREKDEALQMGQQQLTLTRQEAQNTVEVLRAKLKELWSAIGQIKGTNLAWPQGCIGKPCHASGPKRVLPESYVNRPALVESHQQVNASQPIGEPFNAVDEMDTDYSDEEEETQWSKLLPLELHLVGVTITKLLDHYAEDAIASTPGLVGTSSVRSLAALLLIFKKELSKACKVDEKKILMNAIFGRFLRESVLKSTSGIYPIDAGRASLVSTVVPFSERLGEEVVVRFFVHPRRDGDDFASLVTTLQDALGNSNSSLMQGNLSAVLKHASLTTGYQDVSGFTTIPMEKLSNLALPFAISALFTGILIWLAG